MSSAGHLAASRQLVLDELQQNPGRRYQRGRGRIVELAQENDYNPVTLATALVDLASKGYVSKERMGRNVEYFSPADKPEGDEPGAGNTAMRTGERLRFTVGFSRGEDGYVVASVPALPGCHSQGRTIEEARLNIREAMQGYLASLKFLGEPMPAEEMVEQVEVSV